MCNVPSQTPNTTRSSAHIPACTEEVVRTVKNLIIFSMNSNANVDGPITISQPISVQEHQGKGPTFIQVEERQQRERSVGQLPPRHQKTQSQEKHPFNY